MLGAYKVRLRAQYDHYIIVTITINTIQLIPVLKVKRQLTIVLLNIVCVSSL